MKLNQTDKVESTGSRGGAPLGNQNAAKARQMSAMLDAALNDNNKERLRAGVNKIATAFSEGEVWAVNFVYDRLEGKPTQQVVGGGADGEFITKMVVELVESNDRSER